MNIELEGLYAILLILSSFCSMTAMGVVISRRHAVGAAALIALLAALSVWSVTYAFHWVAQEPHWKYFWLNMTYFGVVIVPATLLIFALRYTGKDARLSRSTLSLFSIEPTATLILVWTDPWHGWFFAGKRTLTDSTILEGSPLFWFHVVYSYGLLLVATSILVINALRSPRFYRWQVLVFVASLILPWLINILMVAKLTPWQNLDVTPIVFTFTAMVLLYDLFGWRLLDILPIARDLLVENMDDGVLVLDNQNRVVDFNPSARQIYASSHELAIGKMILPLLTRWPEVAEKYLTVEELDTEVSLESEPSIYLDLHIKPICDKHGRLLGRLFTWSDVTSRKQAQLALQEANQQLYMRIREVESLQSQLWEQAIRDWLTGVYNRRYLDETIERELSRAQREGRPLAYVIMDVDVFKSVNDNYGHHVGDLALQRLAQMLMRDIRTSDIICRYGGDEFSVVMPGAADAAIAYTRAENWRRGIEDISLISSSNGTFHMTVSMGLAVYPRHAGNAEELFRAADDALYEAKRKGKNNVVICKDETVK